MSLAIDLCERGLVPDALARAGMRRLMGARLKEERAGGAEQQQQRFMSRLRDLRQSPIALSTDTANEQHYELPADFFAIVLGKHLKYSGCFWPAGTDNLDDAEAAMLELTAQRAGIASGMRILELGCGWGSLTLWLAAQFPDCEITAVSNSNGQRQFIENRCKERGLSNVRVITADMNDFKIDEQFDRVVSVEMFEHMRNYATLLENVSAWLRPNGELFVHIFCHRDLMYPFMTEGETDWMAKYFFTDGLMPAQATLHHFQDKLALMDEWRVGGHHYAKTANAWLQRMDENKAAVQAIMDATYPADAKRWFQRWRMFFMACAELFDYNGGEEWFVAHYRFRKRG